MYLVNESSKLEPVNRVYKIREKSQSLLDHPRTCTGSAKLPHKQGKIESIMLRSTVHDFQEDSPSQYF